MPNWKKVVVSGSRAVLHDVTASNAMQGPADFTITSAGKVGINNNDPTYKLDVAGNAGINEYLYHNGDTNTYLRFQTDQTDIAAGGNVLQITSTKISGSGSSTGSFGKLLGDGSDITGISGFTVANSSNNRIITSVDSSNGNAEANLTFDGTDLTLSDGAIDITPGTDAHFLRPKPAPNGYSVLRFNDGSDNALWNFGLGAPSQNLYFYSYGNSETVLELHRDTGRVGIGLAYGADPVSLLQVGGDVTVNGSVSGSASSTGSFGRVEVKDNLIISGSNLTSTDNSLTVIGSGSAVFEVKGTNGTLFSVNDIMSGSIFSANTIAGIPVIEAFSDQKVTLGSPSAPVTITALSSSMDVSGSLRAVPKTDSLTGANNLDFSKNTNFRITITGNITLTPIGLDGRDGQSGIITLIQDGSGGHTISLNSTFKTPRGDSISFDTTANGVALMSYYVIDRTQVAVNYLGPFS